MTAHGGLDLEAVEQRAKAATVKAISDWAKSAMGLKPAYRQRMLVLIAALDTARTDIPALVAECKRLREENARLEATVYALIDDLSEARR